MKRKKETRHSKTYSRKSETVRRLGVCQMKLFERLRVFTLKQCCVELDSTVSSTLPLAGT